MSLEIPCPHCGRRPVHEFAYGEIPRVPDSIRDPDARDLDRAFMHENAEGPTEERWFHTYGCRRWVTVERDTRDDRILRPD
jgi:heterotetrameric sarcosine oxidase delta subunit